MLKSSTKQMSCFPPGGPNLSLERFSIEPSMMSCVVLDEVALEKLRTSLECLAPSCSIMPCSSCSTSTVLPVPVLPTSMVLYAFSTRVLATNELRTVSMVGTTIAKNMAPRFGRHGFATRSSQSFQSLTLGSMQ